MSLSVKLISDVHLEHYASYPGLHAFGMNTKADIICLCGDIGDPSDSSYLSFLTDCACLCSLHTFVIMGNHETYGRTIIDTTCMIDAICAKINKELGVEKLHFLNNTHVDVGKYRFIGTTLWSSILPLQAWDIRMRVSDFQRIKKWGISEANHAFETNVAWLRLQCDLAEADDKTAIVLTHHVPLMELGDPIYHDSMLQSAFASDLSDFIRNNDDVIRYWFYGHNHYSESVVIGKTTVVSNQFGYGKDESKTNYDPNLVIHLT